MKMGSFKRIMIGLVISAGILGVIFLTLGFMMHFGKLHTQTTLSGDILVRYDPWPDVWNESLIYRFVSKNGEEVLDIFPMNWRSKGHTFYLRKLGGVVNYINIGNPKRTLISCTIVPTSYLITGCISDQVLFVEADKVFNTYKEKFHLEEIARSAVTAQK